MAITTYGELKAALSTYMFHQRFVGSYDDVTGLFESAANRRLRVLPMEAVVDLTTTDGDVVLPADYLTWRTVLWAGRSPSIPLEYVHPEYLDIDSGDPQRFTIEGTTFKARPVNDTADAYEFHYYQRIPSLIGNDLNSNWLLRAHPDVYLFGVLVELGALGRNAEMAQLYKARRDELLAEIIQLYAQTTGPTSPMVRQAEWY